MKKIIVAMLGLSLISLSFADTSSAPSCFNLAASCEKSGQFISRHEVWRYCITPLVAGKKIHGVQADPADITSCQEKISMHKPGYWRKHS